MTKRENTHTHANKANNILATFNSGLNENIIHKTVKKF